MCGEPLTPQFRRNHNPRQVYVNLDSRRLLSPPNDPISPAHLHNARQPSYLPFCFSFLTGNIWQRWQVETKKKKSWGFTTMWSGEGVDTNWNRWTKKKKEPKAARTPIEEDTYIYNVHVYGFLFFVENQKKKKMMEYGKIKKKTWSRFVALKQTNKKKETVEKEESYCISVCTINNTHYGLSSRSRM